jgi:hypothetical protein
VEIDKMIIRRITNLLKDEVEEYNKYLNIISARRTMHFYKKAIKCFNFLEKLTIWRIEGLRCQDKFYSEFIKYEKERAFVIISDGLRYESAEELTTRLTNERKSKVELIIVEEL